LGELPHVTSFFKTSTNIKISVPILGTLIFLLIKKINKIFSYINPMSFCYFGTISLSVEYKIDEKMLEYLQKKYDPLIVVSEGGHASSMQPDSDWGPNLDSTNDLERSPKMHCHWVGFAKDNRSDNVRNAIIKRLENSNFYVTEYSVKILQCNGFTTRVGYCLKTTDVIVEFNSLSNETIASAKEDYAKSALCATKAHKAADKGSKSLNAQQICEGARAAGVSNRDEFNSYLNALVETSQMSYNVWQKLNWKKAYMYITRRCDHDHIVQ